MIGPVGAISHKLDMAGRLKLRDEERKALGTQMVMSCGFDNCIAIYTPSAWERFVAGFQRLSRRNPNAQDLKRLLLAPAEVCEVDGQDRVRLPEFLLRWADLGGGNLDAYMVQVEEGRWECWQAERWREFLTRRAGELKEMAGGVWSELEPEDEEAQETA